MWRWHPEIERRESQEWLPGFHLGREAVEQIKKHGWTWKDSEAYQRRENWLEPGSRHIREGIRRKSHKGVSVWEGEGEGGRHQQMPEQSQSKLWLSVVIGLAHWCLLMSLTGWLPRHSKNRSQVTGRSRGKGQEDFFSSLTERSKLILVLWVFVGWFGSFSDPVALVQFD